MYKFKEKLKKIYLNKYQFFFPSKKFINYRNNSLKNILLKTKNSKKSKSNLNLSKKIYTSKFLEKSLKKITLAEKKIILFFYKKYNKNLYLNKVYSKKLKNIQNHKTSLDSYIYLGNIIINLKELNEIQKLNFILKINDVTILKYTNKYNYLLNNILKNTNYEKKITKKYAKRFLSNIS